MTKSQIQRNQSAHVMAMQTSKTVEITSAPYNFLSGHPADACPLENLKLEV